MKKKFLALILAINLIPAPIASYANDNKNDNIVNETLVEKDFEKIGLNITEDNITELKKAIDFNQNYGLDFFILSVKGWSLAIIFSQITYFILNYIFYSKDIKEMNQIIIDKIKNIER